MLNSQILEVAIGLVFVYLLFSLVCSMAQEWLASAILKSRPKTLFEGITSLINDPETLKQFYGHPLINALAKVSPKAMALEELESSLRKQPSSIPSRTFALALLDILAPTPKNATEPRTIASIRDEVNKQSDWLRGALLPLLDAAQNDLEKAYQNVEKWYDDAMERVTGWYKRRTQLYLLILALLVCPVMNVDTFAIANSLYRDKALRDTVVAKAEETAKKTTIPKNQSPGAGTEKKNQPTAGGQNPPPKTDKKSTKPPTTQSPPAGTVTPPPKAGAVESSQPGKEEKHASGSEDKNLKDAIDQVKTLNLPIGWVMKSGLGIGFPWNLVPVDQDIKSTDNKAANPEDPKAPAQKDLKVADKKDLFPRNIGLFKFLGWLFTALAVSLGAPFWFDLLNKLVNLRGAGKTPEPAAKKK